MMHTRWIVGEQSSQEMSNFLDPNILAGYDHGCQAVMSGEYEMSSMCMETNDSKSWKLSVGTTINLSL